MSAIVNDPYLPQAPVDGPSIALAYPHGIKSMSKGEWYLIIPSWFQQIQNAVRGAMHGRAHMGAP
jgi:hypothetical protein